MKKIVKLEGNMTSYMLELKGLHKVFDHDLLKKQVAINELSCGFLRGEVTGFMGDIMERAKPPPSKPFWTAASRPW